VMLLAMALVAATLATMSAASAFADELSDSQLRHKIHVIQNRPDPLTDELSDSQLRHKIHVIQNRPDPLTNQERNHIQNLKDRIHDNDGNDDDDDDD
jgi:hypothetical protein